MARSSAIYVWFAPAGGMVGTGTVRHEMESLMRRVEAVPHGTVVRMPDGRYCGSPGQLTVKEFIDGRSFPKEV